MEYIHCMPHYNWSNEKNDKLRAERGISFEQVVMQIAAGNLKAVYEHPNKDKYTNQRILVVEIDRYCYLVPFVEDEYGRFLKTIIPSRRATRMYIGDENEKG